MTKHVHKLVKWGSGPPLNKRRRRHRRALDRLARESGCTILEASPPVPKKFDESVEWYRKHIEGVWSGGRYPTVSLISLGERVHEIVPDWGKTTKKAVLGCLPLLLKQLGATRYLLVLESWLTGHPTDRLSDQSRREILMVSAVDQSGDKAGGYFEIVRGADGGALLGSWTSFGDDEPSSPWMELFKLQGEGQSKDEVKRHNERSAALLVKHAEERSLDPVQMFIEAAIKAGVIADICRDQGAAKFEGSCWDFTADFCRAYGRGDKETVNRMLMWSSPLGTSDESIEVKRGGGGQ